MTVYDNFPKAPYPEGKYSYSTSTESHSLVPFELEDFDLPLFLTIRKFTQSVELADVTVKDLEYHTMDYLDKIPVSRFNKRTSLTVGSESWFGGGLTQGDLDYDPLDESGYTQAMLNLLTQHGIEQAPAIVSNDPFVYGQPAFKLDLTPGGSSHYSSIYLNDNLISPPFDDPLGNYEIQLMVAIGREDWPGGVSVQQALTEFEISFSSSLNNDPAETDVIDLTSAVTDGSIGIDASYYPDFTFTQGVAKFPRSALVNADLASIKRIDIKMKTSDSLSGTTKVLLRELRLVDTTNPKYEVGINTKSGELTPVYWTGNTGIAAPAVYNIGQNKAQNYTHYTRYTRTTGNVNSSVIIHHRVDDDGEPKASVIVKSSNSAIRVSHRIESSTRNDDITISSDDYRDLLIQTDLEGDLMRTLLWEVGPGGRKGALLYNSQEVSTPIGVTPTSGRVAIQLDPDSPTTLQSDTSSVDYSFSRDVVVGEIKTNPFRTITPIIGATIYASSSPARQLIRDYFSGQEGNAINHLGSPVRESGNNNGEFEIIPGTNDVTVSLDTNRVYAGLPSYRVRKHSNALIGGMQWAEPIRMSDPGRSSVTGAIRFDNNVLGGSFRIVLWDEHFQTVQLILPIKIENTPGKWHQFNIPIGTENIMELNYKVQIQHVGPTQGVGSFWVGGFKLQTDTVEWALSNDGERFVSAAGALNTPFSSVNFTRPGKTLVTRARAYHPTAWVNRFEVTPRWDKTGVLILPEDSTLTYASLPDIPEIESYEDIPEVFESYSEMEDQ